jgi:GNAT superfamily N-acetyltransferase
MVPRERTTIRPFDGSLAYAQGLLDVERATFDECPYSAKQVQSMLTEGPQRAWLALGGDTVIGFVIAFCTAGLQDPLWEIDLLAVHPDWQGQRLGTRLIRASAASTQNLPRRARAYVATDNVASARAFSHAGLRPAPETFTLLVYRTGSSARGRDTVSVPPSDVIVREMPGLSETTGGPPGCPNANDGDRGLTLTVLQAEKASKPAGHAELLGVQTLLYRGVWIESLRTNERTAREALISGAIARAFAAGFDEIGAMVEAQDWPLRDALLAAGFRSLGGFRRYTARLPLPGLAAQDLNLMTQRRMD